MRRFARRLSMLAITLLAVTVTAQTRPDFSGKWTSEPEPAPAAPGRTGQSPQPQGGSDRPGGSRGGARGGDMGSGWGSNITVTQHAGKLTIEYAFFSRGDMQPPLKFVYALDGSETKNSVMMGRGIQVQESSAAWDGDKLVIKTLHTFAHPETGQPMISELTQTLSLESPTRLLVEATRSGVLGGPPSSTRTVYRK